MARPTKFNIARAVRIIERVRDGKRREDAAAAEGVGIRTLQDWLRRGRSGEWPFSVFSRCFEDAAETARRRRLDESWRRYRAESKARWQRFKAARQGWWLERLGPERFWTRRLQWLWDKGHEDAYWRTLAQLEAAGFRVTRRAE
jgi:hypothetical protein